MTNLFEPGLNLMRNLRINRKVSLIAAMLLLPLLLLIVTTVRSAWADIADTKGELRGVAVLKPMAEVMQNLQVARGLTIRAVAGDTSIANERDKTRVKLREATEALNAELELQHATKLIALFQPINSKIREILGSPLPPDRDAAWSLYTEQLDGIRSTLLGVGEETGLLFDPDADTFFLMNLNVERLQPLTEAITRTRLAASDVAEENHANPAHNATLHQLTNHLQGELNDVRLNVEALVRAGAEAPATWDSTRATIEKFTKLTHRLASSADAAVTAASVMAAGDDAHGAVLRMSLDVNHELERLLAIRLRALWLALVTKLVTCALGIGFLFYLVTCFYEAFAQDLRVIQNTLTNITDGDLSQRLELPGHDELADVANQIDAMSERLSAIVSEVRSSAVRVGQAGLAVSEDGKALSKQTEDQAAGLRQSVSTVEELSGAVSSNAEAAVALEHMTASLRDQAEAGAEAMGETVNAIMSLQESAKRIGEINNVINDIAFQTNLLALNASVEAARAGESGRGFAVVASEVRQLAQRCAEAASEVHDVIDQTTDLVDVSVMRISEVSGTLTSVVQGVGDVSLKLKSIATASEQQSLGLQEVTATVGSLDDITHLNAGLVDRSSNASKTLVSQAEALRKSVAAIQLRQGSADEAQSMVERAVARIAEVGWSRASMEFNNPHGDYVDRDLYLFGLNRDGTYVVMGKQPAWVGQNIMNITAISTSVATEFMLHANDMASQGRGWVEYDGPSIENPEGLRKAAYVVAIDDDTFLGCGVLIQASQSSTASFTNSRNLVRTG